MYPNDKISWSFINEFSVGKPIEVPRVESPSAELVDEYHEKFFKALYDLFEEYKGECDESGDAAQLIMK